VERAASNDVLAFVQGRAAASLEAHPASVATLTPARIHAAARAAAVGREEEWLRGPASALGVTRCRADLVLPAVYRRLAVALFPRSDETWIRIHQDGTIDARGLVTLGAEAPADQRSSARATTIRCTSVQRRVSGGCLPFRLVARVPHVGRGAAAGSQARWRKRNRT
jgi:hypothetical protein